MLLKTHACKYVEMQPIQAIYAQIHLLTQRLLLLPLFQRRADAPREQRHVTLLLLLQPICLRYMKAYQ